ncbi:MAG TPA: dihydropteroate synthase [bacterium]|nr:dihydropteroate synthase [bacterium]
MAGSQVRIISIDDSPSARSEMGKIGVHETGVRIMEKKAFFYSIKVENVKNQAANIIKQEMLSLGGETAVSRDVLNFSRKKSDVLLLGTEKQFRELIVKLSRQPFALPLLSQEIKKVLSNYQKRDFKLSSKGHTLQLGKRTLIMGVLNVTPDSFYDGGRYGNLRKAVERALEMVEEGADIIDIGGESSRPGANSVEEKEELERVIPVIKKLSSRIRVPVSIDTYKSGVAKKAIDAGASIVNDISALRMDEKMAKVIESSGVPVCLMHMQGTPRNMQRNPRYKDVVSEIFAFLRERIDFCEQAGIDIEKTIVDPGIGFGKTVLHNLEILKKLDQFKSLGRPIIIGVSRKSLIGKVLQLEPEERLEGSLASAIWCMTKGASILRVHDVRETKRAIKMVEAIAQA